MKTILSSVMIVVVAGVLTGMSRMDRNDTPQSTTTEKAASDHRTVKPHASIDVKYKLPKAFVIDTPETLRFTLINGRDADDIKVSFTVDEGLLLNTSQTEISFGAAGAGSRHAFEIQLTPRQNGLYYINLFASMLIDGKYQTRSFAIPVSVGDYDLQKQRTPAGVVTEDPSGQKIIDMPALETTD